MIVSRIQSTTELVDQLASLEPIKTWSLLVTIFGDFHRTGKTELSGSFLKEFLAPVGIKPEAIRVALHRLRKDGWIETEKQGRETRYRLSSSALEETKRAYADVYRSDLKFSDGWILATFETPDECSEIGISIAKQTSLLPKVKALSLDKALISNFDAVNIPDWLPASLVSEAWVLNASKLAELASNAFQISREFSIREAELVRILILHHWRRMALRDEVWCLIWLDPKGTLAECQRMVHSAIAELRSD
ncbi:MAG: hypothetical protein QNJ29_05720 [Rhizobiaceae bacterium]|nr:hypothetical protein [Rhizobiaceae bacterium]